jgi:hypothetical protein
MKMISPLDRLSPDGEVACGLVIRPVEAVQVGIEREPGFATRTAIGLEIARSCALPFSERLAFGVLWIGSLFAIGYCLKTVLTLPWPG